MTKPSLTEMFAAAGVQRPEDSIGFLLWRVAHRHQREVDRVLAAIDLTHLQFVVLVQTAWLARDGEAVTQAGLARYGKVHPMQLSNILKTLEAKQLITRRRAAPAARSKLVALTPGGIDLLARALPRVQGLHDSFFGDDTGSSRTLHACLRQLVASWPDDD
ncbi:MAG: MarR family transcriptional regulator [Sphingomonadaceae bacterium]|nr:MarR family transcriptional regulator [Sphingomonadaceae bacterium]